MIKAILSCVILLFFSYTLSFAEDTKYFSQYSYKHRLIGDIDYLIQPEFRLNQNISNLYSHSFRTGILTHPFSWLDLNLFYRYKNSKDTSDEWYTEHIFEFDFIPKIIIFGFGGEEPEEDKTKKPIWLKIVERNKIEIRSLDFADLSETVVVFRLMPKFEKEFQFGVGYIGDEIFYNFRDGEVFQNWIILGVSRPITKNLYFDLFYMYESLRDEPHSTTWTNSHIVGTKLSWAFKEPIFGPE